MQIVIDIPEMAYNLLKSDETIDWLDAENILNRIVEGVVLPKGHGRLGDLDKLEKDIQNYHDDCAKTSEYTRLGFETAIAVVEDAGTIIEADNESDDYYRGAQEEY